MVFNRLMVAGRLPQARGNLVAGFCYVNIRTARQSVETR
jgi:hypothetical protein